MGSFSVWHILALAAIVFLLFGGRGKISDLMGDVAKGIKSFRAGLNDPEGSAPRALACPQHGDTVATPVSAGRPVGR